MVHVKCRMDRSGVRDSDPRMQSLRQSLAQSSGPSPQIKSLVDEDERLAKKLYEEAKK